MFSLVAEDYVGWSVKLPVDLQPQGAFFCPPAIALIVVQQRYYTGGVKALAIGLFLAQNLGQGPC